MTCEVWIERGYRRNHTEIVEPKFMWREVAQPNLQAKRRLSGSTIQPYRVSLFSIRRILRVTDGAEGSWEEMHMSHLHPQKQDMTHSLPKTKPMAKPNSLILLRSSIGEDFVFEASCPEERDLIVHLWKMTTARLVSHAVSSNGEAMVKEYFNEDYISGGISPDEVDL